MIYTPVRNADPSKITNYIGNAVKLAESFPDFILGFDLVGQEDLGRPLIEFKSEMLHGLEKNPGLRVFFHAGETNWQGSSTDLVRF